MKRIESLASAAFGLIFVGLALAVAVETVMRKALNVSLQGVDELGGYCLAVGGALAFAVALGSRAHIRIDVVHESLPASLRIVLNVAATLALAASAAALAWMAWIALSDSILFGSTAQTPWATPLRYPQALWVAALALFAGLGAVQAARVLLLAARGRFARIDREFSPRGAREELEEEVADIKRRGADALALDGRIAS
jgi:TRAP-type C4-dicarboxylate transport system permease small subunit